MRIGHRLGIICSGSRAQRVNKIIDMRRIGVISAIMLLLFLLCLIWPVSGWFKAFIKIEQMRLPYVASFFVLLFVAMVALQRYLLKSSIIISGFFGLIVGHIASTISISIATLFDPYGMEGMARAIHRLGITKFILHDLSVSIVLGGWLFGMVGVVMSRFLISVFLRREDSGTVVH